MQEILLTPGPTQIPERILKAMNTPAVHHRSDSFKKEFKSALSGLKSLLCAEETPIILTCSGTGAMEAALLNIARPGDEIVTVNSGAFGARWKDIGERLGLKVLEIKTDWGDSPNFEQCLKVLDEAPCAKAFCVQQCETSTTVSHNLDELLTIVRTNFADTYTIVDGISACGAAPVPTRGECIDIYVVGSQKALMLPPGLSFLSVSPRVWKHMEKTPRRSLYFDLLVERAAHAKGESAWTPATHLVLGLNESLRMLNEEGLENVYNRHARIADLTRTELQRLGLQLLTTSHPSRGVTGFFAPEGLEADDLRKQIKESTGLRIAGGQGLWSGKVLRVGHMGQVDELHIRELVRYLESVL